SRTRTSARPRDKALRRGLDLHAVRSTAVRKIGWHFQDEQEFLHGRFSVVLDKDVHLKYVIGSSSEHWVSLEDAGFDNRLQRECFLDSRGTFYKRFEFADKGILQQATLLLDFALTGVGLQVEIDPASFVAQIERKFFVFSVVFVKYQHCPLIRTGMEGIA